MAVHPEWTGRGIGRLLYRHCERAARERGARRFEVFSSLNAERFYRALGFEPTGRGEDGEVELVLPL